MMVSETAALDWRCLVPEYTTVLVAEDDAASREIVAHLLRRNGYRVIVARDGREALDAIYPGLDVALIDWMMPGVDGVEVCRLLKDVTGGLAHVIMVTARAEKSNIVEALDSGADDYMIKPVDHQELMARVRAGERAARRERQLARAYDEARSDADYDGLTGLMNRRCFDRELRRHLRQTRARDSVALLMIDLDHFKEVNDLYGHRVGDEVLRQVSSTVEDEIREGFDIAARYGGEEMTVILPRTSSFCALEIAQRIRSSIAKLRVEVEGHLISVTASIGVSVVSGDVDDVDEAARSLIDEADTRLYQAKRAGRNRVAA